MRCVVSQEIFNRILESKSALTNSSIIPIHLIQNEQLHEHKVENSPIKILFFTVVSECNTHVLHSLCTNAGNKWNEDQRTSKRTKLSKIT